MNKETQKDKIIHQLESEGYVTRNWCLGNYITRLGARICDLKKKGWEFKTENIENDYVYTVIKTPNPTQGELL